MVFLDFMSKTKKKTIVSDFTIAEHIKKGKKFKFEGEEKAEKKVSKKIIVDNQ